MWNSNLWLLILIIAIVLNTTRANLKTRNSTENKNDSTNTNSGDIVIGPCRWVNEKRQCPDENIKFYLYTRKNPMDRQELYVDETLDKSNLTSSYYNGEHATKIIIHGYNADMFMHPLFMMREEYLAKGNFNLIYVEWIKYAPAPCYISAVHNTKHVGACIAQLVKLLVELGTMNVHVIGFSLGGQVPNYIAKNLQSYKLNRISALDPAMPLFVTSDINGKLDPSDAHFVDAYHTNALVQGKIEQCGHADFYMNGGITQPGCANNPTSNIFACSHNRAALYFLESIRSKKGFWGWSCSSYIAYLLGMCPETNYLVEAGDNINESNARGMYLVKTNDTAPFALGKWTDLPTLGVKNAQLSEPVLILKPPKQKGDPLLRNIDLWGKIDSPFNYYERSSIMALLMTDKQKEVNGDTYWTNFSGTIELDAPSLGNQLQTQTDINAYSIEEQKDEDDGLPTINDNLNWNQYRMNLTDGFIDVGVFRMPQITRN